MVRIWMDGERQKQERIFVINMLSTGPGRDDTPKKIESEEKK